MISTSSDGNIDSISNSNQTPHTEQLESNGSKQKLTGEMSANTGEGPFLTSETTKTADSGKLSLDNPSDSPIKKKPNVIDALNQIPEDTPSTRVISKAALASLQATVKQNKADGNTPKAPVLPGTVPSIAMKPKFSAKGGWGALKGMVERPAFTNALKDDTPQLTTKEIIEQLSANHQAYHSSTKKKEKKEEIEKEEMKSEWELSIESAKLTIEEYFEHPYFVWFMAVLTIWALYSDDLRLAFSDENADLGFDVVITLTFILFLVEIFAQSFYKADYLPIPEWKRQPYESWFNCWYRRSQVGSFYFWLDWIATLSLILQMQWLLGPNAQEAMNGGDTKNASNGVETGSRAGRIVRLVRMVRLLRMVKLYKLEFVAFSNAKFCMNWTDIEYAIFAS